MIKEGHNSLALKGEWKNRYILTRSPWKGGDEIGRNGYRERKAFLSYHGKSE